MENQIHVKERSCSAPDLGALLDWYDKNRRILPWREDPTPYHVWLSEIMLQQTRVEAVRGYYLRFLETLPDIASLAAAKEDVYLKLWEGLGYYSRVRNLHKGAAAVMEEYGGELPHTAAELCSIPGIGPYTAAAIASIAFGECVPAIDGNLLRVFARLTAYGKDIKAESAKKAARAYYLAAMQGLSPEECHAAGSCRYGDVNQALMDLGAMVCLPNAQPLCGQCPFRDHCAAHAKGAETAFPVIPEKKARKEEDRTVFLIHDADRIALRKRPAKGLLAGLYEYPNTDGSLTEQEAITYVRGLGFSPLHIRRLPDSKHVFTHKEWHLRGYEILADELAEFASGGEEPGSIFLAAIPEIRDIWSVPSAFAAYTDRILGEPAAGGRNRGRKR